MMIDKQFADLPAEYKKDIPFADTVYQIAPTPDCPKGTRGRMAVFEMFKMDKEIENAILKDPTELSISASSSQERHVVDERRCSGQSLPEADTARGGE